MDQAAINKYLPEEYLGLTEIEGISIVDGLNFCGSIRDFDIFLESFYLEIDARIEDIETSYNRGDIAFFTIKVHALKTVARIIGAGELCAKAASFEEAGKNGDSAFIDANIGELITLLRSYRSKLDGYMQERLRKKEEKQPISDEELGEAFAALREIVPTLDYDAMESILGELSKYSLPDVQQKRVDKINRLLHQFDWDELEELLEDRTTD